MRLHNGAVLGKDVVKRRGRGGAELFLCGKGMGDGGDGGEGTVVRGRRCVVREEDDAADRWGRSASERERARERGWQVGLACQRERERSVRVASRVGVGWLMGRREDARARGRGKAAATWARLGPTGGRRAFSFSFCFQ
jgi:hypothetical protein